MTYDKADFETRVSSFDVSDQESWWTSKKVAGSLQLIVQTC